MTTRSSELSSETSESAPSVRHLESLDDIPREIAERRIQAEFSESVDPEQSKLLHEAPDVIENQDDFEKSAMAVGIEDTDGLRGFASRPEDPAHVLRLEDVSSRIETEAHEDLHRLTHPELLKEANENPALKEFYEGVTQFLTEQAMDGLHDYQPGEIYPEQTEAARHLAVEVGDQAVRDLFFKHEMSDEVRQALDRISA
jgi:hypothetical protein